MKTQIEPDKNPKIATQTHEVVLELNFCYLITSLVLDFPQEIGGPMFLKLEEKIMRMKNLIFNEGIRKIN